MLNLLPEDQKKKVVAEYTKRIWATISLGAISVVIISATFLIPVYLMSHGTYADSLKVKRELEKQISISQKDTSAEGVKDIAATVSILKKYTPVDMPSRLIESVIKAKPGGISLARISYTPSQDSPDTIDITGKANTRASLVSFSKNLQADTDFSSIYIPISNFAREKDIDFSVKLLAAPRTAAGATSTSQ